MPLNPRGRLIALVSWALLACAGCAGPCDELADVGCAHAGEASEACVRLRERTARVSTDDKRACSVALALVETLEKAR
jgi:hypothetical protein